MIKQPALNTTVVSAYNYEWQPVDFKSFLTECHHIQSTLNEACLFRGHRKADRILDSTFARSLKLKLGLPETHRYPEETLSDIKMQHALAKLWLQKVDGIQLNPDLVKMESQGIDPYFEYHRHHQHNRDDPNIMDIDPKGTNFLDFSYDWKVGLYFANEKREDIDEGALFIVRQTMLKKALLTNPFYHIIEALRNALNQYPQYPYDGWPLLVCPEEQLRNPLDPKPTRQNAVYIAQMDFRFDVGLSWMDRHFLTGDQIFMKLILPAGTQQEVTDYLSAHGITRNYLFPSTIFDKLPAPAMIS
ncbi:MAG: hypothetical protein HYX48_01000 [Chlamydiales bacterium]|nr:hypothetical protein [Chlamydiales bacterium]